MENLDTHSLWMVIVFMIGYTLITLEHLVQIDKAATALLMGVILWVIQFQHAGSVECGSSIACLGEHIFNISQIIFFLLGALAIVAVIDSHNGFTIVADIIKIHSKKKLLWIIGILTFFLSSILDNLTSTIVMVTLLGRLVERTSDRLVIGGGVVIAANAGGVWTPIGDITTTMLWIGGQISTSAVIRDLFIPSLVSMVAAFVILSFLLKGKFSSSEFQKIDSCLEPMGKLVFFLGVGTLIFVPIFKIMTGLPPFMGILIGLGFLWLVTDLIHARYPDRDHLRVSSILSKVEFTGLLFFLGILLAIDALDSAGILQQLANWLNHHLNSTTLIAALIGLASAIVDNVPLVAATMGMYSLEQFPMDHEFWQKIAYSAGTGGSILIIGSAAGVVYMALEKVHFLWYLKNISLAALVGFFAGLGTYLMIHG